MTTTSDQQKLHSWLSDQWSNIDQNGPLSRIRKEAWEHFVSLGLPSRKWESYRYLKLRNLYALDYTEASITTPSSDQIDQAILPECKESALIFVNGQFKKELSRLKNIPSSLVISSLTDAMQTYSTFLQNQWKIHLQNEVDPFAAINGALHQDGLFLYLPPQCKVDVPLQIVHILDAENPHTLIFPRVHVVLGAHSELSIISTEEVLNKTTIQTNHLADISLAEGARLHLTQLDAEPHVGWTLNSTRATLQRNSFFHLLHATQGSRTSRQDVRVALQGEGSEVDLKGLTLGASNNEAHTNVLVQHKAPHCRSNQLFKTLLKETSRSSFEGKIFVEKPAQKTEAYQMSRSLLLNEGAQSYAKPNLEIFADDVKASHGATVGQIDPEQKLYLMTRGLSSEQADQLLISSFCNEVCEAISTPSLQKKLKEKIKTFIQTVNR